MRFPRCYPVFPALEPGPPIPRSYFWFKRTDLLREVRELFGSKRRDHRAAEQRDEVAPFQLMEVHSKPASQVGWQDSEGAANSQRVSERPYNLFAGACAGRQTTNR